MTGYNTHIFPIIRSKIVNFSVKKKLRIITLIQSVIFAVVTVYLLISTITGALNQYKNSNDHCMAEYTMKVHTFLEQMKEISLFPIEPLTTGQYQEIYSYLADGASFVGNYSFSNAFWEKAKSYLDIAQGFDLIAMYDSSHTGLYCWKDSLINSGSYCILDEDSSGWLKKAVDNRGAAVIIPVSHFTGSGIPSADCSTLCVARSITHIGKYNSIGILLLGISQSSLDHEFDILRASENEDFLLLYDGEYIAGNEALFGDGQQISPDIFSENGQSICYRTINSIPSMLHCYSFDDHLSMITLTPMSDILRGASIKNLPLVCVLFILLLSMFLFTFHATSSINHSISLLVNACTRLENGEFHPSLFPSDEMSGEFETLFDAFGKMTVRIDHLVNEILQKDLEKREIELYALRGQINSHYLYNTLESIRMKAYMQKSYDLAEMAMLLGSNLQYNLKEIDDEVTIQEEVDSVRNYIKLIQFNYGDGLTFSINIAREIMQFKIMKLVLQPIIENTISHAFGSTPQLLHIDITGYTREDEIVLSVADDGIGMTAERLLAVRESLVGKSSKNQRVGLRNINKRIRLFYGNAYGVEINSAENLGTVTSIHIPKGQRRKGM